jgi:manganese transport protein
MMATRPEALPRPLGAGERVLCGHTRASVLPFLGPAFIACVAYIDPGNFATNIAGGSKFGYTLLWVIVASNLMAMLIQTLSAKFGIATGRNLPEICRQEFPGRVTVGPWLQA